jgi:hypothetical protein
VAPKRDELPVITAAYRLAQGLIPAVDRMPRGLRTVIGTELVREAVGLCACLHEAALHGRKLDALRRADVHLTRTRVLVRMAFDQKALAPAAYEAATEQAEQTGKMIGGWLRARFRRRRQGCSRGPPGRRKRGSLVIIRGGRLRGGSFNNNNDNLRCDNDNNNDRDNDNNNIGFRCCSPGLRQEPVPATAGSAARSRARHGACACACGLHTSAPGT